MIPLVYIKGKKTILHPKEYYTQENYEGLLEIHRTWLDKEIAYLKKI